MRKLPWEVAEALRSHKLVQAQLVGAKGLAWVLTDKKLFMWYYHNGQRAAVLSHALPYALSEEPCHVCAVQHQVPFFNAHNSHALASTLYPMSLGQKLCSWCCSKQR